MRFCSLASSSRGGNAYLVEGGDGTRVLVDCGLGIRRLEASLLELGVLPQTLSGVLVTHDHRDHVRALWVRKPFTAKHGVPLLASEATLFSLEVSGPADHLGDTQAVRPDETVRVGGLQVLPFLKPHDAPDPLGFLLDDGSSRLGVVTDLGRVDPAVARLLEDCTYLIFEANHDVRMELTSGRPQHLIDRVLGDLGHLSNEQAARALAAIVGRTTRLVVLAHLSDECNLPELAFSTVSRALDQAGYAGGLAVAPLFGPSCFFSAENAPRSSHPAAAGGAARG